jgi:hypothetical protein
MVYFGGITGGALYADISTTASSATANTIYCIDAFDYATLVPTEIIGIAGAPSGSSYAQTIAVLDASGTVLLSTTNASMPAGGTAPTKWTVSGATISGGAVHSWCTAVSGGTTPSWLGYINAGSGGNWLTPGTGGLGVSGAPINTYTCSVSPTGSGSSFAIPQYGNCPSGHGTRTAISTQAVPPMAMMVNQ